MTRLRALLAGLVCRWRGHDWWDTGYDVRGEYAVCRRCGRWDW